MPSYDSDNNRGCQARLRNENGQGLVELGLVLGLIAVVCIIALTSVGFAVSGSLDSFESAVGVGESATATADGHPTGAAGHWDHAHGHGDPLP